MRTYALVLFGLLTATGFLSAQTTVSGRINGGASGEVVLRYTANFITYEEIVSRAALTESDSFRFVLSITRPVEAVLEVDGADLPLFLEPGQSLDIELAPGDVPIFGGDGAAANRFLQQFYARFGQYDMAYLQYELTVNSAMDYRHFLDRLHQEKLDLLNAPAAPRTQWSPAFREYLRAEIDYWWAFHLMRYRYEHPLRNNMPSPETLPYAYYDFLHTVPLSNDGALSSPHYSYFIDLFVRFVREQPVELEELSANEPDLLVRENTVLWLEGPLSWPLAVALPAGTRLHSMGPARPAADWRRVRTYNGIAARVPAAAVKDEDWAAVTRTQKPVRRYEQSQRTVRTYLRSRWDNLKVYRDPFSQDVMAIVHRGFEAPSKLGRTTDKLRYKHQNRVYLDHYLSLEMPGGQTGWVFRGGVNQQDRVETQRIVREQEAFTQFTVYKLAKDYLDGEVLQYALAKDIFLRSHLQDTESLREDVDYFLRVSEAADYRAVVEAAYASARQRRADLLAARADSISRAAAVRRTPRPARPTRRPEVERAAVQLPPPATCSAGQPTRVTLSAADSPVALVVYADPILFQEAKYTLDAAHPTVELELYAPVTGVLSYRGREQRIYLEPGDALRLDAGGATLSYAGSAAANNAALRRYDDRFAAQDDRARRQVRYAEPANFRNLLDELYAARRTGLKDLLKQTSPGFREYLTADADYWYGYQLLNYPWEHPIYHNRPAPQPVPAGYYTFLDELPINRPGALPNMNYTYFLQQYLDYAQSRPDNDGATVQQLAERLLTDEVRTYHRAKQFVAACARGQAREVGEALSDFLQNCAARPYDGLLRYTYNDAIGLRAGSPAPDFTLTDIDGRAVSLSDFRGKVVYIDFWATWCAPCIRYMHHGKQLQRHYAGEDVVFLYVCLDKEADNWARYVALNGLTGVHVAATTGNAYHSQVAKLYNVSNLPRYYLIDADGNVARNPAAAPSGSAVRGQIDALLYSR